MSFMKTFTKVIKGQDLEEGVRLFNQIDHFHGKINLNETKTAYTIGEKEYKNFDLIQSLRSSEKEENALFKKSFIKNDEKELEKLYNFHNTFNKIDNLESLSKEEKQFMRKLLHSNSGKEIEQILNREEKILEKMKKIFSKKFLLAVITTAFIVNYFEKEINENSGPFVVDRKTKSKERIRGEFSCNFDDKSGTVDHPFLEEIKRKFKTNTLSHEILCSDFRVKDKCGGWCDENVKQFINEESDSFTLECVEYKVFDVLHDINNTFHDEFDTLRKFFNTKNLIFFIVIVCSLAVFIFQLRISLLFKVLLLLSLSCVIYFVSMKIT